jgi:N-acetylmuramoyl-L-alanine amidase
MKQIKSLVSIIFTTVFLNTGQVLAGQLTQWSYNQEQNQLEFTVEKTTTPNYFILENPVRIVIDLPNTELGNVKTKGNYSGRVREIRLSQFTEGVTRLVVELSPSVKLTREEISLEQKGDNRWLLGQKVGNVTVTVPDLEPVNQQSGNENKKQESPPIQFGQPLPPDPTEVIPLSKNNDSMFLKQGAKIILRYDGEQKLTLVTGKTKQEVLVLAEEIALKRDVNNLIIPKDSEVIGSFETETNGNTIFVTQAITIEGQNFPLQARSEILPLQNNNILEEASLTQSVIIEPGLIVQVELTEDWGY